MNAVWIVLVLLAIYVGEALIWPVRQCRLCDGQGRHMSPVTGGWRSCRCDGGTTVKWPARLLGRA